MKQNNNITQEVIARANQMMDLMEIANPDCYKDAFMGFYNMVADGDLRIPAREQKWIKQAILTRLEETA